MEMKFNKLTKGMICLLFAAMVPVFCAFGVAADEESSDISQPEVIEEIVTEAPPQEFTEPETELVVTDPIVTEAPAPETEALATEQVTQAVYTEPATEAQQTQAEQQAQTEAYTQPMAPIANIEPTTEFVAPTLPKTVSEKKYSTNSTAGTVSWICVGVGILVALVMIISTKLKKPTTGFA